MKPKCAAFVIASLLVFAMLGSAWAESDEEQLKKFETDRAAAVVKGDFAVIDKSTADDYTFANVDGQVLGKAQLLNALKSGDIKLTAEEVSDMKVRVYGNTAVVTGNVTRKGTVGGKDASGKITFTRVLVKKGGTWQAVALQQTKIANP